MDDAVESRHGEGLVVLIPAGTTTAGIAQGQGVTSAESFRDIRHQGMDSKGTGLSRDCRTGPWCHQWQHYSAFPTPGAARVQGGSPDPLRSLQTPIKTITLQHNPDSNPNTSKFCTATIS